MAARRRTGLLAAAVAATGLVVAGSVALAALPGLQRITETSASDSTAFKNVVTACPPEKKLLGAAGRLKASTGPSSWIGTLQSGRAGLTRVVPLPSLSAVSVSGVELGADTAASWAVQSYGLCETDTAAHGLQHVQAASANNSSAMKSAQAACPLGKRVIGAGGAISTPTSSSGKVVLTGIAPNALLTGVDVTAEETAGGTTGSWQVVAYAVCATAANIPGLEYEAVSVIDSSSYKYAYVDCPAGKKVTGAAGRIGGLGPADTGKVALTGIAVHAGPAPRVSAFAAETDGGTRSAWSVVAIAICATP